MFFSTAIQAAISIHALHEESDVPHPSLDPRAVTISIHALHEESDPITV
mgnify:CR=1 FL=1